MELINIYQLGIGNLIILGIGTLFIIEQISNWILGSYTYRYGIPVKKIKINNLIEHIHRLDGKKYNKISIKLNDKKGEIYVRYRYPMGVIGPLVFVGQIKYIKENLIIVRIGPVTLFCIFYFINYQLFLNDFGIYRLINDLVLFVLIYLCYINFLNLLRSFCLLLQNKNDKDTKN